ncbi:MAG: 3-methyl-2-oxobutanoate hydroxymethyltransferase [Chloroflexi bacterium]|nr:3-methyl-2-oxobutanoate hydroxymethyltransferase [Chloroflexota bacterium]
MVMSRVTIPDLRRMKEQGEKITMLTAYDYLFATLIDEAGIDVVLVGDSLGMVVMGYQSTLPVTVEQIIHHSQAVATAVKRAMVVADMPFMSYEVSDEQAISNAGRLIKEGGAQAVKVEGGNELVRQRIGAIVGAGIPVMGHLGLTPQTASLVEGYKVQGKDAKTAQEILEQARLLEQGGVFSLLLECIPMELAKLITDELSVPVIGIGAGVHCDGQVLVTYDLLGLYTAFVPKHVKQYCNLKRVVSDTLRQYASEVKGGQFPGEEHSFHMRREEFEKLVQEGQHVVR